MFWPYWRDSPPPPPLPPQFFGETSRCTVSLARLEGQVVYVRAVIGAVGKCGQLGIVIDQPNNKATVVIDQKEIRREDRERLGISA